MGRVSGGSVGRARNGAEQQEQGGPFEVGGGAVARPGVRRRRRDLADHDAVVQGGDDAGQAVRGSGEPDARCGPPRSR